MAGSRRWNRAALHAGVCAAALLAALPRPGWAQTTWIAPPFTGASISNPANWSNGVPGPGTTGFFGPGAAISVGATTTTGPLQFTGNSSSNFGFQVLPGVVWTHGGITAPVADIGNIIVNGVMAGDVTGNNTIFEIGTNGNTGRVSSGSITLSGAFARLSLVSGSIVSFVSNGGGHVVSALGRAEFVTINAGGFTNNANGAAIAAPVNDIARIFRATLNGGTFTNNGLVSNDVIMSGGTFTNNAGASAGLGAGVTVTGGTFANAGATGTVTLSNGTFNNGGTSGNVAVSGGMFNNNTGATIDGTLTLSGGRVNFNGGTITGTATLNGGTLGGTGTVTLLSTVVNSATTFDPGSGGVIQIAGTVSGVGALTITGAGAVRFNGMNTYSGGTTVTGGGRLQIGGDVAAGAGGVTLAGAGTLEAIGNRSIANAIATSGAGVTIANGGVGTTFTFNNAVSGTGAITFSGAGTTILGADSGVGPGGSVSVAAVSTLDLATGVTFTAPTISVLGTLNVGTNASLRGSGSTTNVAGSLNVGAGGSVIDATAINVQGTINVAGAGSVVAPLIDIAAGGVVNLNGPAGEVVTLVGDVTGAGAIQITDGATLRAGGGVPDAFPALTGTGDQRIGANIQVIGEAATIDNDGRQLTLAGVLAGNQTVMLTGAGTTRLTGTNITGGAISVAAGTTVSVENDAALGATIAGTSVATGGTLRFSGGRTVAENVGISGAGVGGAGAIVSAGTNTLTGDLSLGAAALIVQQAGGSLTLQGGISLGAHDLTLDVKANATLDLENAAAIAGTGGLIKAGDGVLNLGGNVANTFGGQTRINAGTLRLLNAGALGNAGSGTIVAAGATLALTDGILTEGLTLSGTGVGGAGAVLNEANSTALNGMINLAADALIRNAAAGTVLTLGGAIDGTGVLTLQADALSSIQVDGALGAGPTGLVITGSGQTVLAGNNAAFTGPTTIVAGANVGVETDTAFGNGVVTMGAGATLQGLGGNRTLANAIALSAGADAQFQPNGSTVWFDGLLSGAGGFRTSGSGTLILTGANSYQGTTTINAGTTLQLGTGGLVGTLGSGAVVNNGTLAFQRSDALTIANAISGNGGIMFGSTGDYTLSGANTMTGPVQIADGATLRIGFGGTEGMIGSAPLQMLGAGARLVFNRSGVLAAPGVITGGGQIDVDGGGMVILTGSNNLAETFTGQVSINDGTLRINGDFGDPNGNAALVTVNAGGALDGIGRVFGTVAVAAGRLSPGNSIGTLDIAGNLMLAAGSVTIIEVLGPGIDRINVTGTATLGGTLQLVPLGGPYLFDTPYTFLTAASLVGPFASVTTAGSFGVGVTPEISYTATSALLTLKPAALTVALSGMGLTNNQFAVAQGIDQAVAAGASASGFFDVFNRPATGIAGALEELSGEVHTAVAPMGAQAARGFIAAMLEPTAVHSITDREGHPWQVWASITGATGQSAGDAITGSRRRSEQAGGIAAGAGLSLAPGISAGFAVSGSAASAGLARGGDKANADILQVGAHVTARLGDLALGAAGSYGTMDVETSRRLPSLSTRADGEYRADIVAGRIEAAYSLARLGAPGISPFAALDAASVATGRFLEDSPLDGIPVRLRGASKVNVATRAEIGFMVAGRFDVGAWPVELRGRLGWGRSLSSSTEADLELVGLSAPGAGAARFVVKGAKAAHDQVLVGIGAGIRLAPQARLDLRVDGSYADGFAYSHANVRLSVGF